MGEKMSASEEHTPSRGVVWMRGGLASLISIVVFGFVWVGVQPSSTMKLTEHSIEVMEGVAEEQVPGGDGIHELRVEPRDRAMEEHGEVMEPPRYKGPSGRSMDRAAAIQKAEDLAATRDDEAAPIELRAEAERELQEHLAENFPTAAGDSRLQPTSAAPEPKNGDSYGAPSWDEIARSAVHESLPYLFIAVQGVIGWRTKKKLAKAKAEKE